jgi:hypothetical protein
LVGHHRQFAWREGIPVFIAVENDTDRESVAVIVEVRLHRTDFAVVVVSISLYFDPRFDIKTARPVSIGRADCWAACLTEELVARRLRRGFPTEWNLFVPTLNRIWHNSFQPARKLGYSFRLAVVATSTTGCSTKMCAAKDVGRGDLSAHDLRRFAGSKNAQVATLTENMARLGHKTVGAALRYQHSESGRDAIVAANLSANALADLAAAAEQIDIGLNS